VRPFFSMGAHTQMKPSEMQPARMRENGKLNQTQKFQVSLSHTHEGEREGREKDSELGKQITLSESIDDDVIHTQTVLQ